MRIYELHTRKANNIYNLSRVARKSVFEVSVQVLHKLCTATEDGLRLGISDLGKKGIVLSV